MYVEASAKTGLNVDQCFMNGAKTVMTNIEAGVYDLANEVRFIQSCGIKVSHALSKPNIHVQRPEASSIPKKSCKC